MSSVNSAPLLTNHSFTQLMEMREWNELRNKWAQQSATTRREAAQWEYGMDASESILDPLLARLEGEGSKPYTGNGAVRALVIDPTYAPAVLTVGSIEYQLGRKEEAMTLFLALPGMEDTTDDLIEIAAAAGEFLLDQRDYENGERFFAFLADAFPKHLAFQSDAGYCASKAGRKDEAVQWHRKVVVAQPLDVDSLSDLGWSLVQADDYEEAEQVLKKAIELDPEHEMAQANIKHLANIRVSSPDTP